MASNTAWQRHGCYKLGSEQYFNMPLERAVLGCKDDWNSLDHFDPTSAPYRQMAHFMYIRKHFPSLQDGFNLVQRYNNSYMIELPGSNGVSTEIGFWSVTRSFLDSQVQTQNVTDTQPIWLLYTNENRTRTYTIDCMSKDWIISPYPEGTAVRNLFYPFDTITLQRSGDPFNGDGKAPYTGCVPSITFDPYGFKAYVPVADWLDPPPALTKFSPGHDARLQAEQGDTNATTVDIAFEFNSAMNCNWITQNMKIEVESSGQGGTPTIRTGSVNCQALTNQPLSYLSGDTFSTWRWSGTLDNVPDGIIRMSLTNVPVDGSTTRNTQRTDRLMFRKGSRNNVMVFPLSDYDNSAFAYANGQFTFTHKALGAERFRYSWNYGKNWTDWTAIEAVTTIPESTFDHDDNMFWEGAHIIMQCKCIDLSGVIDIQVLTLPFSL